MWQGLEPKPGTETTELTKNHQVPPLSSFAHSLQNLLCSLATQPRAHPGQNQNNVDFLDWFDHLVHLIMNKLPTLIIVLVSFVIFFYSFQTRIM